MIWLYERSLDSLQSSLTKFSAPDVALRVADVILLPGASALVLPNGVDIKFTNKVQAINKTESICFISSCFRSAECNMGKIFRV